MAPPIVDEAGFRLWLVDEINNESKTCCSAITEVSSLTAHLKVNDHSIISMNVAFEKIKPAASRQLLALPGRRHGLNHGSLPPGITATG